MDQTVAPIATDFSIIADGVPKVPLDTIWLGPTSFQVTYDEPSLSPTTVRLILPTAVGDFRDLTGHLVFPFDIAATPI